MMNPEHPVLGIVGSPNRDGRTNKMVSAVLEVAVQKTAPTEIVQLADHVVAGQHARNHFALDVGRLAKAHLDQCVKPGKFDP